ncbi:MAG: histidine kinase [Bifidobacteriaceae bacterium]|nr:histidine kinase [Bifidobacteriaceae bacterium]
METARPAWRSRAWIAGVAGLATLALASICVGFYGPLSGWIALGATAAFIGLVTAWVLVRVRSQRRRYEDALAQWAAERATQAERLRIARDLHDLASHGLGLITVRATAARRVRGPAGEAERERALADIERTSRQTTTELRRMLAVLRTPGPLSRQPADTIEDLPGIVQEANDGGLSATLDLAALGGVSPKGQDTTCAVVREALHNSLRHAGPTRVSVQVRGGGPGIVVEVQDAGPVPGWIAEPGAGRGLDGLRERVTAIGGAIRARAANGGWLVTAHIPEGATCDRLAE